MWGAAARNAYILADTFLRQFICLFYFLLHSFEEKYFGTFTLISSWFPIFSVLSKEHWKQGIDFTFLFVYTQFFVQIQNFIIIN